MLLTKSSSAVKRADGVGNQYRNSGKQVLTGLRPVWFSMITPTKCSHEFWICCWTIRSSRRGVISCHIAYLLSNKKVTKYITYKIPIKVANPCKPTALHSIITMVVDKKMNHLDSSAVTDSPILSNIFCNFVKKSLPVTCGSFRLAWRDW